MLKKILGPLYRIWDLSYKKFSTYEKYTLGSYTKVLFNRLFNGSPT